MKKHLSPNYSYCYQCKEDSYCKMPRLDGFGGREIRDNETDALVACVEETIKQCMANDNSTK